MKNITMNTARAVLLLVMMTTSYNISAVESYSDSTGDNNQILTEYVEKLNESKKEILKHVALIEKKINNSKSKESRELYKKLEERLRKKILDIDQVKLYYPNDADRLKGVLESLDAVQGVLESLDAVDISDSKDADPKPQSKAERIQSLRELVNYYENKYGSLYIYNGDRSSEERAKQNDAQFQLNLALNPPVEPFYYKNVKLT